MKTRLGSAIRGLAIVVAVACGCLLAGEARAQGPGQKPFESTYRRPNVSAYNQISNFANNPQMAGNIYQQIVQPQQQQQQQQLDMMSQRRSRSSRGRRLGRSIPRSAPRATPRPT